MRASLIATREERMRAMNRNCNQVNVGGGAEAFFPMRAPENLPAVKHVLRPVPDTYAIGMDLPMEQRPHMVTLRALQAAAPYTLQEMMRNHGMPSTPTIFDHATGQIRRHVIPPDVRPVDPAIESDLLRQGYEVDLPADPDDMLATPDSSTSESFAQQASPLHTAELIDDLKEPSPVDVSTALMDYDDMLETPLSDVSSVPAADAAPLVPSPVFPPMEPSPVVTAIAIPATPVDSELSLHTCLSAVSVVSTPAPIARALKRPSPVPAAAPPPKARRLAPPPLPRRPILLREAKTEANALIKEMAEQEKKESKKDKRALLHSIDTMLAKLEAAVPAKLPSNEGGDGRRLTAPPSPLLRGLRSTYGKAVAARSKAMATLRRLRPSARRGNGASINECLSLCAYIPRGDLSLRHAATSISDLIKEANRRVASGGARYEKIDVAEKKGDKAKVLVNKAKGFFNESSK